MEVLSEASQESLLELLGELVGLLSVATFRTSLLRALTQVVPTDWISLNDVGPDPKSTVALVEPPFPPEAHAVFANHAHENPLIARFERTRDGRPYRFSDVATPAEMHATTLYRDFYGPIGLEYQIAFTLPHVARAPRRLLGVALSRRDHDFSDEERSLLTHARPFLIDIYRNAVEHSHLLAELELRKRGPQLPLDDSRLASALRSRGITAREAETLSWVAGGSSTRVVAEVLGLSPRTVHKHLQRCYLKLDVHTRAEAVTKAWSLAKSKPPGPG